MIPSTEFLGVAFALGAALMIALTGLFIRVGTDSGTASDALVVVLVCNLVILVPSTTIYHYPEYSLTGRSIIIFALAGLVGTMLGRAFYYTSIAKIGASRSEAIKASQPLHATAIAIVILGETLTLEHILGILLITFGVAAVSLETTANASKNLSRRELLVGLFFPLGASFFYGIEPTFAKLGFTEGTPMLVGLTIKTIAATIGFLAYLRMRGALPDRASYTCATIPWYVAAGVANTTFLAFYYAALEITRVSVVVPFVQSSPLFVIGISYLLFPKLERVTTHLLFGTVCVITGVLVIILFV